MSDVVFIVEEESMKVLLDTILPILRDHLRLGSRRLRCVQSKGKGNLKAKCMGFIPGQAKRRPGSLFVILCDQDDDECKKIKRDFVDIARKCGVSGRSRIRIVCRELEAWLLGDRVAFELAYPDSRISKRDHANPDNVTKPKRIVIRHAKSNKPVEIAQQVGRKMTIESIRDNTSVSFQQFVSGLARLCEEHRVRR